MKIWQLLICILLVTLNSLSFADNSADDNTGRDDTQTYHIYDEVELVSKIKFQYSAKPKTFVKSVYPLLVSPHDDAAVKSFNQMVSDLIQQSVVIFRQQAAKNAENLQVLPKSVNKNDMYIDYNTSFMIADENPILSVRFTLQTYLAGMAHPYHQHQVINVNLSTGESINFEDLFIPTSNYLEILSNYSRQILSKRLKDNALINEGTKPINDNFKIWNVTSNGLVITFEEATVAPYVYGAQTVLIPYSILKSVINPDIPFFDCVKNSARCTHSHLLTGGFIDQAVNDHPAKLTVAAIS